MMEPVLADLPANLTYINEIKKIQKINCFMEHEYLI